MNNHWYSKSRLLGAFLITAMILSGFPMRSVQAASHWSALDVGVGGTVNAVVFDGSGNLYAGGTSARFDL